MDFHKIALPGHLVLDVEEELAGGVVSSVSAGSLTNTIDDSAHRIVVKQTSTEVVGGPQFSHADEELIEKAPLTHSLDIDILSLLQNDSHILVPQIHHTNKQENVTIMADFRDSGFELMQDLIIRNELPIESAAACGQSLGRLQLRFKEKPFTNLEIVEDSLVQIRERLQEIHTLSYDNLDRYRELETKLLTNDGLIFTDGHPKNIAVNKKGEVMLFDFGRVIHGSMQYPVPNFAAHIGLAVLAGCIPPNFGIQYIKEYADAYNKFIHIEEEWFVKFFVAEVLHRGLAMRWIDKRIAKNSSQAELNIASHLLYLNVLNATKPLKTIDELLSCINNIANAVAKGEVVTNYF